MNNDLKVQDTQFASQSIPVYCAVVALQVQRCSDLVRGAELVRRCVLDDSSSVCLAQHPWTASAGSILEAGFIQVPLPPPPNGAMVAPDDAGRRPNTVAVQHQLDGVLAITEVQPPIHLESRLTLPRPAGAAN